MSATQQPLGDVQPDGVGVHEGVGGEVIADGVARAGRRELWIGAAVVGALTALFAAVNWHWLSVNVVTYGWDRLDHLITSLVYNNMFLAPRLATLYDALAYSNYYPPLVHLGAVALYKFFGVDQDVAAMVNVAYLAVLLASTWAVAWRLGAASSTTATARARAILAVTILGTFPMIYAMSRYLYLDFALTAMVAASVATLLAAERFRHRGGSLAFGAAIGLAFLVKWTTAAFLIGPLIYVVWRSGVVPTVVRQPRCLLPNWRRLLIALAASAALNALWLVPARAAVVANPLGW
jgi:4-amino-4-deoxy-L-arabinose transferase-like glycosyltransferase